MKPKDGDSLGWVRVSDGKSNILLVSQGGKAIQFSEDEIRVMGRAAAGVRGMRVAESDALIEGRMVDEAAKYIFTISSNGMGKISALDEYREQGRGGSGIKVGATTAKTGAIIAAFTLSDEEKDNKSVILISRTGQTVKLPLAEIRVTGRTTQGVILAKIKNSDDAFISAALAEKDEEDSEDVTVNENTNS